MRSFGYYVPSTIKTIQICTDIKFILAFIQSQKTVCTVNVNSHFSEQFTFHHKARKPKETKIILHLELSFFLVSFPTIYD